MLALRHSLPTQAGRTVSSVRQVNADVARAEAAAAKHGLVLDWDDKPWAQAQKHIVSLEIRQNGRRVAGASQTYSDEAGKQRALSFCAGVLFVRP